MRKRLLALALALVIIFSTIPAVYASDTSFTDVSPDDWFSMYVSYMADYGFMNGTGNGKFEPALELSRAMFLTVLGRIEGISKEYYDKKDTGFTDVKPGQWYSAYVAWGVEKGITNGIGGGMFGPDVLITREQMATLVYRYVQIYDITLTEDYPLYERFKDAAKISNFAADAVELMRKTGIITGDDNGYFNPKDNATRAQAATVFARLQWSFPEGKYDAVERKDYKINFAKAETFEDDWGDKTTFCLTEIENTSSNVLHINTADFDLLNEYGSIVATANAWGGTPSDILPGEKGYFGCYTWLDENVQTLDLQINVRTEVFKETTPEPKLSIIEAKLQEDDYGCIYMLGQVKNTTNETVDADINVILYDNAGNVIAIEKAWEYSLASGKTAGFETDPFWLPRNTSLSDIANYTVIAEAS